MKNDNLKLLRLKASSKKSVKPTRIIGEGVEEVLAGDSLDSLDKWFFEHLVQLHRAGIITDSEFRRQIGVAMRGGKS